MNTVTTSDRRSEYRYDVCLDAAWEGTRNAARITDISESACYVDSVCEANLGQPLTINILLPNNEWFQVTGEVAHHITRLGFGLKFVNLSNLQLQTLRWLIAAQRERSKSVPAHLGLAA